ncbi:hypothetical protein [Hyunsoonleella pacifica]|uniref:Uncharacterized protein n=1 Tax=Hyunsoonleella pacifica TaxID=1080224 RepID=A0A4Q9FK37_9FLAO|nr:hypothetical protein [Hyunsoonleella pacifica]TBN13755.1 hypothetical protein EYD46_14760 [Hyunsoonleella pacifica]GGD25371.1 hypothetical protein GCM10011368_29270 [Hyunsoonleella pacifica]
MTLKKYIGVIVVILTLLGIVDQQQVDVHNQEIVLEFNTAKHTSVDSQSTISLLKQELKTLGVTDFKVVEKGNGKLKITYFSNVDVSSVKRILIKRIKSELNTSNEEDLPFNLPFEDHDEVVYNLDVHEIQNGHETNPGLNGIVVLELKPKADRFFKPKTSLYLIHDYLDKDSVNSKQAFNLHKKNVHALKKALQQIPEVRAGPRC